MADTYSLEERCLVDDREAILNKKAVYEPSKTQRFRQIVCSRGVATLILFAMGATMVAIAAIAAFARPASVSGGVCVNASSGISLASSLSSSKTSENLNNNGGNKLISNPTFISTNGEEFPWKDLRLPKHYTPINYDIFLHPNISQSFFVGNVRMTLKVTEKTDFIVFHTQELNLSDVTVRYSSPSGSGNGKRDDAGLEKNSCHALQNDGIGDAAGGGGGGGIGEGRRAAGGDKSHTPGAEIGIKKKLEYELYQQYYIQVEEDLPPGVSVDVAVGFRGSLADLSKMMGLYKSSYTIFGEEKFMISTQFEAANARKAFPCMDEPDLKATFSLRIVREPSMVALFNTKVLRHEPYQDKGLVQDVFEPTVCMSTYLVAFVVTEFKVRSKNTKDGLWVRVWAPEDKIYMGQYALDAAVTIIEKYNEFFGIAYPLDKQDLIAIPNFSAGAMENWGLITYRDTAVLYDPDKSTATSKKHVALVVAHELAHQWFGNLVTMKWWNDLWLNEGFASYVENIGADTVDPSFRMYESMVSDGKSTMKVDSLSSTHPIEVKVDNPVEVESAFNSITYTKGACLIHMLRGTIGANKFHLGLNFYLRVHAYGNAETQQLWEAFEKYTDLDNLRVSEFMDTWTKQMGYPVVTVTRNNNLIELTQERFLLNNDSDTSSFSWHIPFKYKLSNNPNKTNMVWMKKGDASIHLPPSSSLLWIKGNADSEGFYRVNYDTQGWKAITQQLIKDHTVFSVLDRVGFIDDAFNFAQSGRLPYSVVLDLCRYLVAETDYFVWDSAIGNFGFLIERLYLHESYDDMKAYIIHLAKPLLDKIGWEDTGTTTHKMLRTRMLSLAVRLNYEPVIEEARKLFKQWLAKPSVELNNDLRYIIYNTGIRYGTTADWDIVYERFQSSLVPSNKQSLMFALTTSRDPRILQILLERSMDPHQIKSQSTTSVIRAVAANPTGLLYTWRFVRQHWDYLFERYGSSSFTLSSLISHTLGHFSSQFDLDEVTSFFQGKDLGSAKNVLPQTIDIIKAKIAWDKLHLQPVSAWMKEFVKTLPHK